LLAVEDLSIGLRGPSGSVLPVVDQVSLALGADASLGIAGESGCGKSTLLLALMGIVKPGLVPLAGRVRFAGIEMLGVPERTLRGVRGGRMALIPQNAGLALTPTLRIGDQIDEALRLHTSFDWAERQARTLDLLDKVRLPDPKGMARRFPHEFSGGQVQRVAIAMALAGEPELLLLDEPTTGLDVTTQLGILDLLAELRRASRMAFVCVSHDLGVLAKLCDRVAVMYAGGVVEAGRAATLLSMPVHPNTRALIASVPRLSVARIPPSIPGRPPALGAIPAGCRFAPRCPAAAADCRSAVPPLTTSFGDGRAACFHPQTADPRREAADRGNAEEGRVVGADAALTLEALSISYYRPGPLDRLIGRRPPPPTVEAVSLTLRSGEILGLVGESGSGKSTILRAVAGLASVSSGGIMAASGRDLGLPVERRQRDSLRLVQLVFQNPDASLNPRHTVEEILAQPLRLYFGASARDVRQRARALLAAVRLDDSYLARFPGQLSGGERQRVAIARGFAAEPDILLCDEVTSALDVSVQASVLQLLRDLSNERGVSIILVSHDLAVVQALADRVAVLYRGRLVEIGPATSVCRSPKHPYTRALLAATLEPEAMGRPVATGARDLDDIVSRGCPFAGRCPQRLERCITAMPDWRGDEHRARCELVDA
jgi:peptide/nickel transport system ATP-binding protein